MTTTPLEFPQARGHEAEELRFCKDCRWCGPSKNGDSKYWRCLAPQGETRTLDLVTGETEIKPMFCDLTRKYSDCGASGRWFEPRESEQSEAACPLCRGEAVVSGPHGEEFCPNCAPELAGD